MARHVRGPAPKGRWALAAVTSGLALLAAGSCRAPTPPVRTRLVVALPVRPELPPPLRSISEVTNTVFRHAFEPLTELSPDLRVMPCLAESWYNPDDRTWVFRLRRGVQRHDGRILEVRDVVTALRRVLGSGTQPVAAGLTVTEIEAVDDTTLVLRTAAPTGWLPSYLAYVLLQFDGERPGLPPVGTGPYVLRGKSEDGGLAFDAFPGHREGKPPIDRVEFPVIPDPDEAVARLRRGDVHLVLDAPVSAWRALARDPSLRTAVRQGLRVVYLGFNTLAVDEGRPTPVRDIRLRRAIAEAVDRRAIIDGALLGLVQEITAFVPPDVFGHSPELQAAPAFDRASARRSLARAGLSPRALRLSYASRQDARAVAERIAGDLREIGLAVVPEPAEAFGPRPGLSGRPEPDLYLVGWSNSTGDAAHGYFALAHTPGGDIEGSLSGYSNPVVDRLLEEASSAPSQPARIRLLQQVAATLAADVALVPLYRVLDRYAFADGLDFAPRADRRIRAQEMSWRAPPPGARLP